MDNTSSNKEIRHLTDLAEGPDSRAACLALSSFLVGTNTDSRLETLRTISALNKQDRMTNPNLPQIDSMLTVNEVGIFNNASLVASLYNSNNETIYRETSEIAGGEATLKPRSVECPTQNKK